MARTSSLLASATPNVVPAIVNISHVQLRDLIICPRERGIVNYVQHRNIVEHNIKDPDSVPRVIAELSFLPNTLTSLQLSNSDDTLLAAGGQEAEIYLSLHSPNGGPMWRFEAALQGSINNSVLLTSMSLSKSNSSSVEPRVGISNNDATVKFYDIPLRGKDPPRAIEECGSLRLDVAVNHSSISPDGRTLLSVGDSAKVYLHRLGGSSRVTFTPITTLSVPPPNGLSQQMTSSLTASFATAFSSNGSKFAVASQEGVVAVWDVRSSKPLKVFQTDKTRLTAGKAGNGLGSGWLVDDPWEWARGGSKAPCWGARSIKFGSCNRSGPEVLTFTEHTSLLHVIDARTFETEEIVRVPGSSRQAHVSTAHIRSVSPPYSISNHPTTHISSNPPPPPRIVLALEETFRIPSSSPRQNDRNSSLTSRSHVYRRPVDDEDDSFVVIPQMGDRTVDDGVRQLLETHRSHARLSQMRGSQLTVFEEDERDGIYFPSRLADDDAEMEIDELESDCASSHTPSRSSSPSPSTSISAQASPTRLSPSQPQITRATQPTNTPRRRRKEDVLDQHLDLAGTCFDPSGGYLYVASVESVAEWTIRGAGKRWWSGSEWA